MTKTILITGSTDGIGLETAKAFVQEGHKVLLHGRNPEKLAAVVAAFGDAEVESYMADLSNLNDVVSLAATITAKHEQLDVLINNAGIFKTSSPLTADDLDVRFVVNTIAPYLLTQKFLPLLGSKGRVVNLSSAAQAPVEIGALLGEDRIGDMPAYAQSKLAITMWTRDMAKKLGNDGPMIVAVNPGSLLASKMVKEGFGMAGNDIGIGVDILMRASLSDEFSEASGKYFDNDARQFAAPHPEGLDDKKAANVVDAIETVITKLT